MRIWIFTAFALPALLAACPAPQPSSGDDDDDDGGPGSPPPESFADATAEQRRAAIETALGYGAAYGTLAVLQAEQDSFLDDVCPSIEVLSEEPMRLRFEADDCVASSGVRYDGVAEATNVSLFVEDAIGAMRLSFAAFSVEIDGTTLAFDGEYEQSELAFEEDYTTAAALTFSLGDGERTAAYAQQCAWTQAGVRCTFDDESSGSLEGFGAFDIQGSYDLIAGSGALSLSAADDLRVLFDDTDAADCAPVTIDGESVGEFCYEPGVRPTPEPQPVGEIEGSGWGCVGGDKPIHFFDAFSVGDVDSVRVRIATPDALVRQEEHSLVADPQMPDQWLLRLHSDGVYEPQETTQLACDETAVSLVFQALDEDGEVLDCEVGGDATGVDISDCP